MIPTIGRIVYYKSYGTPGGEYPSVDRAAIVTQVYPNVSELDQGHMVDLCVLNPTGMFFNQKVTQGPNAGQWDWPVREKVTP